MNESRTTADTPPAGATPAQAEAQAADTPRPQTSIRCPHCHNPIQLADAQVDEVLCPGCGSSFRLREDPQTTVVFAMRQLGKFQILQRVGAGAFGAVWRARDTELDRIVALKIPHAGSVADGADLARFHREARAAAQLRHPGIVTVHEVQTLDGMPTIVSDFIDGVPLKEYVDTRRLTFKEAAGLVADVAEALDYAHGMGVVHRDIKPANIMLHFAPSAAEPSAAEPSAAEREARVGKPLLTDFGLALRGEAEITLTHDGHIIGTPAYMSPEQAAGKGHRADRRSDVYSLGVLLYELLCGELPFRGSKMMILHQVLREEPRPPRRLNDKVPRDLETVCLKAMAKEPSGRYQTARALAEDLHRFLSGEPIHARPVGAWERGWRWARRRPAVAGLGATSVLLFLLGFAMVTWQWREAVDAQHAAEVAEARAADRARDEETARKQADADRARAKEAQDAEAAEKTRAIAAQQKAVTAQKNAVAAQRAEAAEKSKAVQARQDAEASLYTLQIALAQREWSVNNVGRAEQILAACAPKRRGWEWHYLKRLCQSYLLTLPAAADAQVAFSPDGQRMITLGHTVVQDGGKATRKSALHVWDAMSGKELHTLPMPGRWIAGVQFTPDGKRLVGAYMPDERGTRLDFSASAVAILDAETGKEVRSFKVGGSVNAMVVSADGQELTTASSDATVRTWSLASGMELRKVQIKEPFGGAFFQAAMSMALSPDGTRIAAPTRSGVVKIWETATGKEVAVTAMLPRSGAVLVHAIVFSPDGKRLAVTDNSNVVGVYDADTGRPVLTLPSASGPLGSVVAFSPDGTRLACTWGEGLLKIWDLRSGRDLLSLRSQGDELGTVRRLAFSPEGYRLAAVGKKVWLLDASTGQEYRALPRNGGVVRAVAFSPDGHLLATACEQALGELGIVRINVFDPRSGAYVHVFTGHRADPTGVVFTPDGKRVISGSQDGAVLMWEPGPGRVVRPLRGVLRGVSAVAVSPDGTEAAAAGHTQQRAAPNQHAGGAIQVWDLASGAVKYTLQTDGVAAQLQYTADGRALRTVTRDGTVTVWDPTEGKALSSKRIAIEPFSKVALSADGRLLAIARPSTIVKDKAAKGAKTAGTTLLQLWDVTSGKLVHNLPAGPSDAVALVFSPDGKRLAYSGGVRDRGIHIFDVATGHETFTFFGTRMAVAAIAFSPTGQRLASGGYDRNILVCDAEALTSEVQLDLRRSLAEVVPLQHVHDAQEATVAGQEFAARFHIDRAAAALPARGDVRALRASIYAHFSHWDESAREYEQAIKLPVPLQTHYQFALVLRKRGDHEGYRRLCTQLLKRSAAVTNPNILNTIAWICALGPDATPDADKVTALIEKAGPQLNANYQLANTYGAVLYRAGRYDDAIKRLTQAVSLHRRGGQPGDWLFLAMAYCRKGDIEKAKAELDKLSRWQKSPMPQIPIMPGMQPPVHAWHARLETDLLRREAEGLLKQGRPAEPK